MFVNSGPFAAPELFSHLVVEAERVGIESLWTVEHVVVPKDYQSAYPYSPSGRMPGSEDVPIPDPILPLAYAAALTRKIRLATGVLILPQHHPLYVAKEMATLDRLSGGRAMLGIGSGWLKEEFEALGADFHTRGVRTDEAIQALRALWRDSVSSFHGRHFSFGPVLSFPKPVQPGGVPIHVGGHSRAAVRRAAAYGDGFFPLVKEPERLAEILRLFALECQSRGRDPSTVELTCTTRPSLDAMKRCADLGVARIVLAPPAFDPEGLTSGLERIGNELIARV